MKFVNSTLENKIPYRVLIGRISGEIAVDVTTEEEINQQVI